MTPEYSTTDLEAYVRQRAPKVAQNIRRAAGKARNEADLVAAVEKLLEKFSANFDVTLHLEKERTLINGRADAVYNRFVIEYEPPASLRRSNAYRANAHAIEQVKQYMGGLERLDRHRSERLAGVVLDGNFFIFIRHRDERWRIDDPLPVDTQSTGTFLRYLLSLSTEQALTPSNLVRDFGENSNTARKVVPALYEALKSTDHPKVQTLFRQWQRQFREVSGYDPSGRQLDPQELARPFSVLDRRADLEKLLFSIHTYYAAFIKLLALQVAYYYLMPKAGSGLAAVAKYDSVRLRTYLEELERGGLFAQLGIRNFLEGDFFGWYQTIWSGNLEEAARRLIGDLANYSLVTLDVDPEETRDLLKRLYQNLMPGRSRRALGEYYTPDWLADRVLNQLAYKGDPKRRLLDPACGSGTFLVLAIKRIRENASKRMLPPANVLEDVLENIVGFDLNPLAVISARTNYLLALGDLLSHRKGDITLPVYLADSILTPGIEVSSGGQLAFLDKKAGTKARHPGFRFLTAVGVFTIPRSVVDTRNIDHLADLLEQCVHGGATSEEFASRVRGIFPPDEPTDHGELTLVMDLFEQLKDLDGQGINGIWARIIKNAFAPLFRGRFDYVAGNPPWVNWANLPSDYRQELAPLWQAYGLFPHTGLKARLGGAMDDISILMLYVAADKYLGPKAKLGFVITQTVFKSEGGGAGFRRFRIGEQENLRVAFVDDMSELQPFDGATNRTSVVMIEKGQATTYPVQYGYWRKARRGVSLSTDLSLNEVLDLVKVNQWVATPVDPTIKTSPWMTGRARALKGLTKCIGQAAYKARMGVHCHGNGAYWVDIVETRPNDSYVVANIPKAGREAVDSVQMAVESEFVYPLLRGRDVQQWSANPSVHIMMPYNAAHSKRAYPKDQLAMDYPRALAYFEHFKEFLEKRSGYLQFFNPDVDPYYSMYNVGDYTFAPTKVVWRYIASEFTCAVIDVATMPNAKTKPIIPETKLVLVPFEDPAEAHFLCAILSSSINRFLVMSYAVNIQIATHVLNHLAVPEFDRSDDTHQRLAELSRQAHNAAKAADTAIVEGIETEIDTLVAKLWGLTPEEAKDVAESLKEIA